MARYLPSTLKRIPEFGIDVAAKITGVPEHVLRHHVDERRLLGVRKTHSGRRLISREGLAAYLRAEGYGEEVVSRIDRRGGERISWGRSKRIRLELLDSMGRGIGTLADLSRTGFQAKDLSWTGHLPGPGGSVRFEVLGGKVRPGRLQGAAGEAQISWIEYRGETLRMGFEVASFSEAKALWSDFVSQAVVIKHEQAKALLAEAKPLQGQD